LRTVNFWVTLTGQIDWSIMKSIQASEAKARFSEILSKVEGGETIVITRHGREIAEIRPSEAERRRIVAQARAEIEEMRKTAPRVTAEEILAWRDEGRK
jgi:prevent-host-death family protein